MTAQYQLRSIQKRYGSKLALELEELVIWPGRLYVLMGLNGSGKSTLLNILAFLSRPEEGEIIFNGDPVGWNKRQLGLLRRRVTLLHQSPYLFGGTVAGNIAFGLRTRGVDKAVLRQRVTESMARVGLAGFEERKVGQLSGGEAQRVALARALALQPEVLLLDEPLANVDKETTAIIEPVLASLPGGGTTVIISTHDSQLGEGLDAEIIRLKDGRPDLGVSVYADGPRFRWRIGQSPREAPPRD